MVSKDKISIWIQVEGCQRPYSQAHMACNTRFWKAPSASSKTVFSNRKFFHKGYTRAGSQEQVCIGFVHGSSPQSCTHNMVSPSRNTVSCLQVFSLRVKTIPKKGFATFFEANMHKRTSTVSHERNRKMIYRYFSEASFFYISPIFYT